jgi:hypothetical protein
MGLSNLADINLNSVSCRYFNPLVLKVDYNCWAV